MPSVLEILCEAEVFLSQHSIDSPRLSAQILLARVLGISRLDVLLEPSRHLTPKQEERFSALLHRRAKGEPVAYLVGSKEFYGLDFQVDNRVLIPRPETEEMMEIILRDVETQLGPNGVRDEPLLFADIGTGSGVLAVTLAYHCPHAQGFAVDVESDALEVARSNACGHGVDKRVCLVHGDFLTSFPKACLDLIVTNPPYVSEAEYKTLSHEVAGYEPRTALVGGQDGLDCFRAIEEQAYKVVKPGGILWAEMGWLQGEAVQELFGNWQHCQIRKDLAGKDRFVRAVR